MGGRKKGFGIQLEPEIKAVLLELL